MLSTRRLEMADSEQALTDGTGKVYQRFLTNFIIIISGMIGMPPLCLNNACLYSAVCRIYGYDRRAR
jgi:hypothetical protein